MRKISLTLSFLLPLFLSANGYVADWNTPNKLQPVQSLYIRPSADGTTGDLFVAASENNGISSQWVADHGINFLSGQTPQNGHVPLSFSSSVSSSKTPGEEVITTQKRTMLSSPPISYAYPTPEQAAIPYQYSVPSTPQCVDPSSATPVQYSEYPYPYNYYPYLMSAMQASAAHALRDSGLTSDLKELSKALSTYASAYPYGYNWPYYMMNPQAWAQGQMQGQSQAAVSTTTPAPSSTTPKEEFDSSDEDLD